ncbi:MAG: PAS domain S-box protein [Desulfobacterales bacterium]|nr:PAS domain S-box protein [Desulfobacterales bacterium]
MKLRTKLAVLITVLIIFITGSIAVLTVQRETKCFKQELKKQGLIIANTLARECEEAFIMNSFVYVMDYIDTVSVQEYVIYVMVRDEKGRVRAHSEMGKIGEVITDSALRIIHDSRPLIETAQTAEGQDIYEIAVPVTVRGNPVGTVQIGYSLTSIVILTAEAKKQIIMVSIGGIIVGVFFAFILARQLIKPITKVKDGVIAIAGGNFNTKMNVKLKNEIGELASAFNQMALYLKAKDYTDNIIKSMIDTLIVVDADGMIQTVNQATLDLLGYTEEEIIGSPAEKIIGEEVPLKTTKLERLIEEGELRSYETCYKTKDGKTIPILFSGSVMKDEDNNIICMVCSASNITERKHLETQLKQAEKMEAIGTLAGGVAHDLNNILSGIVSYPELLLMDIPEGSPLRKPILTIIKSGKRAAAIVQDLLTLARRGVAITDVINLNNIISDALISLEYGKIKEFHPNVKVKTELETTLLNIFGSPVHLSKSILNLVSNAAEAMPEGGKVIISTQSKYIDKPIKGYDDVEEGDYVMLMVSDTGIGISSEDIEKIFEPFYTKKVMGRSGTGLGMTVVWGTVKDHKGYIDVQSTKGRGTRFTLYFPVSRRKITGKEKALPMEEYMGKGESILVVDDVEEQCEIASRMLKKLGYSVSSVSSGEESVDYMKDNSIDLLVLDMIMEPGMDGLDTYKKMLELHPGQKAIIASGFSETDRVKEAQRLGAGKYIKKPYTLENIGLAVKEELEK